MTYARHTRKRSVALASVTSLALFVSTEAWSAGSGDKGKTAPSKEAKAKKEPPSKEGASAKDAEGGKKVAPAKAAPKESAAADEKIREETRKKAARAPKKRPKSGPGSLAPDAEYGPMRPFSAQQVESVETEEEGLRQLERELKYYKQGLQSYATDVRMWVKQRYESQRDKLAVQYDQKITGLEREERMRRKDAIRRFEEFLKKYPDDSTYTPDAMFRLAELYFERSSDQFLTDSQDYDNELEAFERGGRKTEPEAPEPSYAKTISLHDELINRFPEYRLADAARYLLGYCYSEGGDSEKALAAFEDLVAKHPKSPFQAEVWTRIGEIHFEGNRRESLKKAIAAYGHLRQHPTSPYYDKAMYKIAWTYYRLDMFPEAVSSFIDLIDYADKKKKETGKTGSELRSEAVQYVAISLADEEWGGLPRAKEYLSKINKDYVAELWRRYGEVLYDQTRYTHAVNVLAYTIDKYPHAPANPAAQEKIIRAHEQMRDFDSATSAREMLVRNYSKGSDWYRVNEKDPVAIAEAKKLTERSLYTAAIFRHQQAQAYKASRQTAKATLAYRAAASAYQTYLNRFPDSKNSYDFEFYLAECYFYSSEYARAAKQYDRVRDSQVSNKHLDAAALSSVIAHEREIEDLIKRKKIADYPLLTAEKRKGTKIKPRKLDAQRKALVEASDRMLALLPNNERAPAVAYRAGELFYRHDQFDEARRRFEALVVRHPANEVAQYASNLIIESYLALQNWAKVEEWSQRLIRVAQKSPDKGQTGKQGETDNKSRAKFVEGLKVFKVGAQFKQAERYDQAGEFERAAQTYVRLVDDAPSHEFADKALFNAAISYEKVKRFDSASKVYRRLYKQYPKSELSPRALFRVGINAEKGFDFPAAIQYYTALVNTYPKSEHRSDALYNVAVVHENMQQYGKAAESFKRYSATLKDQKDAGEVYFRAALVYEKMKAWDEMIQTLDEYIRRYGSRKSERVRSIDAQKRIGDAYMKLGRPRKGLAAYRKCVRDFARKKLGVRSPAGSFAAKCAFENAESAFRDYSDIKIEGSGQKLIRALTKKAKTQQSLEKSYKDIFKYKRVETTLAALYRMGHSYERFAESLFNAPIPKEFQSDEEIAAEYKAQLEDKAAVLESKAETAYRRAFEEARKTKVSNEWSERTLEGLNKYAPQEFPIQKRAKSAIQTVSISARGLDSLAPKRISKPTASSEGAETAVPSPAK